MWLSRTKDVSGIFTRKEINFTMNTPGEYAHSNRQNAMNVYKCSTINKTPFFIKQVEFN